MAYLVSQVQLDELMGLKKWPYELFNTLVIQSWYVMGRLGAYNSSNLQLANTSIEYNPLCDLDKGFNVMPSSFHGVCDVEFQDNCGRVVFGGRSMGDWEEGMRNPEDGYKYFKI
ncbi:hypothetical protein CTI12_AA386900 [Artemisia annua]|uniref:Uncharacterized protein n=1 Tax=Artemisia annua TaxID=35608 RepID=A0A2U1MF71_ARTAN|nr:hypothetical protein CTI12_AA386900 [Artemisia annua]